MSIYFGVKSGKIMKKPLHSESTDIMAILDSCDSTFYPNINHLLRVLETLPVSITEVEWLFSTLKRVK